MIVGDVVCSAARPPAGPPHILAEREVATSWVFGVLPTSAPQWAKVARSLSPRQALEAAILPLMADDGPFSVAFSGGRDSSLILAIAAHVAKREGLPAPVAVTLGQAAHPEAEEHHWQEIVIDHLRDAGTPVEWRTVQVGNDQDLLSPTSQDALGRHGLIWPPTACTHTPMLKTLDGGWLITGEGGDEILGGQRISQLVYVCRRYGLRSLRHAKLLLDLAPAAVRRPSVRRMLSENLPASWLRPAARAEFIEQSVSAHLHQPLDWREATWQTYSSRATVLMFQAVGLIASEYGVKLANPLLDPGFVAALARRGGRLGLTSRAEAMRLLAADLLPEAILTRQSKADFSSPFAAAHTQEFVRNWSGEGLPEDLVDVERLQQLWQQGTVPPGTFSLVQAAWMHDAGLR